jgi:hypothetical protein
MKKDTSKSTHEAIAEMSKKIKDLKDNLQDLRARALSMKK